MNERLKGLIQYAGFLNKEEESIEYLVKLIVEECIGIVQDIPPGYKDYRDQIEDAFRRDCIATMREHFGVENETE